MINIIRNATTLCQIASFILVYHMANTLDNKVIIRIPSETIIINSIEYRDTCDSQFMKAIIETECHKYSKQSSNTPFYPPVGDGGRAIGIFQMHEIYHRGCELAQIQNWNYQDMFNEEKATAVFWAKMGVYAYKFNKENDRLPTYEELACIHNAGYVNRNKAITYLNKFRKHYKTKL